MILSFINVHQSFVSTDPPPHLQGWMGIVTFHFSEPWYRPHPVETSSLSVFAKTAGLSDKPPNYGNVWQMLSDWRTVCLTKNYK